MKYNGKKMKSFAHFKRQFNKLHGKSPKCEFCLSVGTRKVTHKITHREWLMCDACATLRRCNRGPYRIELLKKTLAPKKLLA